MIYCDHTSFHFRGSDFSHLFCLLEIVRTYYKYIAYLLICSCVHPLLWAGRVCREPEKPDRLLVVFELISFRLADF